MLRKPEPGEILNGNERFEGYCKDLADLIARKLGINCEFVEISKCAYFTHIVKFLVLT